MSDKPTNDLLVAARERWLADDHQVALDLFRRALQKAPDDLRLAVEVASYLGMRFEVEAAVEIPARCETRLADHGEALHQIGLAYDRAFRPDDAVRCFQKATRLAPRHTASWVKIAEWHERRGDLAGMRCRAEIGAWLRLRETLTQPWS